MGLTAGFQSKHVRPLGADAVTQIFKSDFTSFLMQQLQMSAADVRGLMTAWNNTALLDPQQNEAAFVGTANDVAAARWSEYDHSRKNTVVFLNAQQLKTLSAAGAGAGANRSFVADFSGDPIAIAVTIPEAGAATVAYDVKGINVSTDGQANICHLTSLEA